MWLLLQVSGVCSGKGAAQFGEEWSGVDEEHIKNMKDKFKEEKKQHGKKTNVQSQLRFQRVYFLSCFALGPNN